MASCCSLGASLGPETQEVAGRKKKCSWWFGFTTVQSAVMTQTHHAKKANHLFRGCWPLADAALHKGTTWKTQTTRKILIGNSDPLHSKWLFAAVGSSPCLWQHPFYDVWDFQMLRRTAHPSCPPKRPARQLWFTDSSLCLLLAHRWGENPGCPVLPRLGAVWKGAVWGAVDRDLGGVSTGDLFKNLFGGLSSF